MRVIVTSRNPVKLKAVARAFEAQFPGQLLELESISADSGVAEQPLSDDETRLGAKNRVAAAARAEPTADFWVGIEGGVERFEDTLLAFAWMVVRSRSGVNSETRSATLPLPPAVVRLLDQGMELGEANDKVFSTSNSKQQGGAFGLLTDGRYTRESIYTDTLILALIPFVNELFKPH